MIRVPVLVSSLLSFVLSCAAISAGQESIVHVVRFTDYQQGSIDEWLRRKGFQFEQDAKRRDRIDLRAGPNGLVVEAKRRAYGLLINETVDVREFSHVEIDWGVIRHPQGASYEQGVRSEALMVIIFMGDERKPSGSKFIPDSPYFIGLYLCSGDDREHHPYPGSYFRKSGRYVCTDRPSPGRTVTSRFDLLEAYRAYFDKERDDDPGISGLALAVDTTKAGGGGTSSAFVREIRFFR